MASMSQIRAQHLEALKRRLLQHVGRDVQDVEAPAAIVDWAVAKRNCAAMLEAVDALGLGFRAHVKTHKTIELARMQVGNNPKRANLIMSTVAEAEHLLPLLEDYHKKGTAVNVTYGLPPSSTCYHRLKMLRDRLGPDSVSFLIDHPAQLENLRDESESAQHPIHVFIKVDAGYHRAGVAPGSKQLKDLLQALETSSHVQVIGLYAHMGNSYGSGSPEDALEFFAAELEGISNAAREVTAFPGVFQAHETRLILSVGATPTASSAQNLLSYKTLEAQRIQLILSELKKEFDIELHAGVYPLLDMQQLATRARPKTCPGEGNDQESRYA